MIGEANPSGAAAADGETQPSAPGVRNALRVSRHGLMKGATAAAAGVAGATYVKPSLRALGIASVQAASGGAPDTIPPFCAMTGYGTWPSNDPIVSRRGKKYIQVTVHDGGSGLNSIVVIKQINLSLAYDPPGWAPGTTAPVIITATKVDNKKTSQLDIETYDRAGNMTACDPYMADLEIGADGAPVTELFENLCECEHKIRVDNGTPGVTSLTVDVNGTVYSVTGLTDGEVRFLDVAASMRNASDNMIRITASGPANSVVSVLISD